MSLSIVQHVILQLTSLRNGCHHRPFGIRGTGVGGAIEHGMAGVPAWWEDGQALARVVSDLMAEELALARPARSLAPLPWPPRLDLFADLATDSLDRLALATALAGMLHLRGEDDALLARPLLADWLAAARSGLRLGGGRDLTFRTSGSSGAPKRCTHRLSTLWQEVGELARLLPGRRRILCAVPAHHIYGFLFSVLLPQALGIAAADVIDVRSSAPAGVAGRLRDGDLVVGHPDFWRALARAAPALPPGVDGVTSTAPCPDEVAESLASAGLGSLLQVYGSSETGGVGWRTSPASDYRLFPYWSRAPEEGKLVRILADGSALATPLQDRLDWSGVETFRPLGRIDQAVQVGGVNVFPQYVSDVLQMHPAVYAAAVRPMRADEGTRLKAFVVPRPGQLADAARLREELAAWVRERLAVPERPAAFSFGEALPRKANGKPADWIIDAWL
jgi:4-coumarate--CoA ligase